MLIVSGCSIRFQDSGAKSLGGIFKSLDSGNNWNPSNLIPTTSGSPQSIGRLDTNFLILDPSDNNALYLGSTQNGLFFTYNAASSWQPAIGIGNITPTTLAINPQEKCTIYASSSNSLYKSTDCTRTWVQIYHDDSPQIKISSILINHYSPNIIHIGTSRGELILSDDSGASWRVIKRFQNNIKKLLASPFDSRILIASVANKGLFKSENGGKNWVSLENALKIIKSKYNIRDIVFSVSNKGMIVVATDYGILKSYDNGETWGNVNLIAPKKGATTINSIALGNLNPELIYYTTNTTFYRSIDGGEKWVTKKLPTSRAGWQLILNPKDDNIIYLGVRAVKK